MRLLGLLTLIVMLAPACAGHEYSFLFAALWKPESPEVSSTTP